MNLKDDKQQNIQLELDFFYAQTGEARPAGRGRRLKRPGRRMEPKTQLARIDGWRKICERENLEEEALRRVKANQGSAGVDGMSCRRPQRLPGNSTGQPSGNNC